MASGITDRNEKRLKAIELQKFLNGVTKDAPPKFQETLAGIANYFRLYGYLTEKQRQTVYTSAQFQRKDIPDMSDFGDDQEQTQPLMDDVEYVESTETNNERMSRFLAELGTFVIRWAQKF